MYNNKRRKKKRRKNLIFTAFLLVAFIFTSFYYIKINKNDNQSSTNINNPNDPSKNIKDDGKSTVMPLNNSLLENILKAYPDKFKNVLDNAQKYDVQILYTQINRNADGTVSFIPNGFNVDKNKYFYPASSMKLTTAILALDKLNTLNIPGVNKYTTLEVKSGRQSQSAQSSDVTAKNGKPSIAQYIKKLLVASDNDSYNRLYEFLGQEYLNETLWSKGYKDVLIRQRIADAPMTEENRYTNPFVFYGDAGNVIYEQPMAYNSKKYESLIPIKNTQKGISHEENGVIVEGPHDFSQSNYISIETLQDLMKAVMFPESIPESKRFNLTEDDLSYLRKYLSTLPKECTYPSYDLPDNYAKYFMYGSRDVDIPSNIKIYNKIGTAYGYLVDNAYIVDNENNVEFLLTAVIHSNNDGVFADSHFNPQQLGMPFLTDLGNAIYNYELNGRAIK
jgi:beta-lactamase class A